MSEYNDGDKVRFKGDDVTYLVQFVNSDGSVDLREPFNGSAQTIEYVPDRLLEPAPREVKPGQVWRDGDGDLFVVGERKSDGRAVVWYHFGSCTAVEENFRDFELVAE